MDYHPSSHEQRAKGLTDLNDLATQHPEVVSHQLNEVLQGVREQRLAATQWVELAPVVWDGMQSVTWFPIVLLEENFDTGPRSWRKLLGKRM
jgi:hypothetical protein